MTLFVSHEKNQFSVFSLFFLRKAPIVRHEAGEALAALGDFSVIPLLEEYAKDEVPEVAGNTSSYILIEQTKRKVFGSSFF